MPQRLLYEVASDNRNLWLQIEPFYRWSPVAARLT